MTTASITDHETRVRERAYEIWDAEGRRDGWSIDHWLRAQHELTAAPVKAKRVAAPKATGARTRKIAASSRKTV